MFSFFRFTEASENAIAAEPWEIFGASDSKGYHWWQRYCQAWRLLLFPHNMELSLFKQLNFLMRLGKSRRSASVELFHTHQPQVCFVLIDLYPAVGQSRRGI